MSPFIAHYCFADAAESSFKAGLADQEVDTRRYVWFERLKEPDEQGLRLGFDAPYLEIDDQGMSGYGLIEKAEMTPSVLRVHFNAKGTKVLQTSDPLEVHLDSSLPREEFAAMMSHILGAVFSSDKGE